MSVDISAKKHQEEPINATLLMFDVLTEIHMLAQLSGADFNQCQDHKLHMSHFRILNKLFREGAAQTPQALAKAQGLTKATMTSSLKKLSDEGLVEMFDNPKDARSKLVFLTTKGKRMRLQAIENASPKMVEYAASLSTEMLKSLLQNLRELHQSVDTEYLPSSRSLAE